MVLSDNFLLVAIHVGKYLNILLRHAGISFGIEEQMYQMLWKLAKQLSFYIVLHAVRPTRDICMVL